MPIPASSLSTEWSINGQVMAQQPTTTALETPGTYMTSFSSGLIGDLLSLLIGGKGTVTVKSQVPGSGPPVWQSASQSTVTIDVGSLLSSPKCEAVNG